VVGLPAAVPPSVAVPVPVGAGIGTGAGGHVDAVQVGARGAGRLRVLDGLRLVAALAVVAFHYTGRDNPAWGESVRTVFPTLSPVTLYGGFGPYLFFMISGFVVLMSAWGRSVPSFIASRVGRLYPAYWVAVIVTAAVLLAQRDLIPMWDRLQLPGVVLNMTMFQSAFGVGHVDGVYWTLWVEMKFYLLLVAMALIGITRQRMLALCLAWPVLGALAGGTQSPLLIELLQPDYAPFFCIGILLYLVYREGWSAGPALLLGLNYLFALWAGASYYMPWSIRTAGAGVSFRGLALLLTLSIIAIAVATLTPVARVDWRWLTVAGALTYPLYLLHENLGWLLIHRLAGRLPAHVAVGAVVLLMLVVAHLVHRYVERPLGRVLRRAVERDLNRAVPGKDAAAPVTAAPVTAAPVAAPRTAVAALLDARRPVVPAVPPRSARRSGPPVTPHRGHAPALRHRGAPSLGQHRTAAPLGSGTTEMAAVRLVEPAEARHPG
jgi:peptidoglycan/LPS O-acetylase OafA/YrhL